jgi:hypothetical protein
MIELRPRVAARRRALPLACAVLVMLGHPVSPPGTQTAAPDILRTVLVIRPDVPGRRLALEATLTIANPSQAREFTFLLADWYTSVAVRSRSGPAAVTRESGEVTVRVTRPVADERLVFTLAGEPGRSDGEDRPVIADSSLFLLWSDRFYPADFDDWTVLHTRIELPAAFQLLVPGRRLADRIQGGRRIAEYETSEPIRIASVMADTRWVEQERTVDGWRMRTLLYPEVAHYADQIFATSSDVLTFYASRFGRWAFDDFSVATVDSTYARRSLAGSIIYSPAYLRREMDTTGHDAHETALLWWFSTIAGRGPGSYQWIEGFGDYAEFLYDEARGKPRPPIFDRFRSGYLQVAGTADEPPITALRGPHGGAVEHGRLPWTMHLLRFAVGDSAFDAAMRLLFARWRFRTFTLDEFVATLAEGAGQPLAWWKEEWLDRGGVPALAWHAEIAPGGGEYQVAVTVRQTGQLYHLPLEIGIETASGMRLERVRLDDSTATFRFHAATAPTRVLLDPRGWLLAKVAEE